MFCECQHVGSCEGLPVLAGCCPGQLLFCDSSGNLDVHQPHLSLVTQMQLARKGAMMAVRVGVHQGDPSLPGRSVTYFSQKRRQDSCACAGSHNDGGNGGWRLLRDVSKTSRELRDQSILSVGFLTCLGNNGQVF